MQTGQTPLRSEVLAATLQLLSNLAERRQHLRSCERTDFFTWTLDLFPEEFCCPADACRFILLLLPKEKSGTSKFWFPLAECQRLADDPTLLLANATRSPQHAVLQGVDLAALGGPSAAMAPPAARVNATARLNKSGRSLSGSFGDTGVELQLPSRCATRLLKDLWGLRRRTFSPLMPPRSPVCSVARNIARNQSHVQHFNPGSGLTDWCQSISRNSGAFNWVNGSIINL